MNKKIIFLLIVFLAIGVFLRLNVHTCMYGWDESGYLQNAEVIGNFKDNFNELNFRPPLLSGIIACLFHVYHSPIVANLLVTILGALSIPLIYKIGEEILGWKTGIIAAFVLTFCNVHIILSQAVLTHAPALFFALCSLYAIKLGEKKGKLIYFGLSGLFAALAILTRFTYIALMPVFLVNLLLYRKSYDYKKLAILAAAFFLALAPYLLWNHLAFGDFFYTFKEADMVAGWSPAAPLSTYYKIIPVLLGGLTIIGLLLWLFSKSKEKFSKEDIFLLAWAAIFIIFTLKNPVKEIRYLLGSLPGFVLISAKGFAWFFGMLKNKKILIFPVTVALILFVAVLSQHTAPEKPVIEKVECNSTIKEAALYLETLPGEVVYAQYAFNQLALYTNKTIVLAPFNKTVFMDPHDWHMNQTGYYVLFKAQHDIGNFAEPEELDSRFVLNKTIGENWYKVWIYEFTPKNQVQTSD